jgi:pimeloyl-ACP methyl ester carboxylesterase
MKYKSLISQPWLAILLVLSSCNLSSRAPMDRRVNIGTHALHIHCVGRGGPTVVIDTGITETYESWEPVMELIAQDTRVCAYDRAGYGQSEPGPMPRDCNRAADELSLLLLNARVEGPFVLVGHSLGGLNMQVFAARYPDQAVGAVLLDPPPLKWIMGTGFPDLREMFSQQTDEFLAAADAPSASSDPAEKARASFYQALASENEEMLGRSADQLAAIDSFGDLPLVVIAATEPNPGFGESAQAFQRFWIEQSQELAGKSANGSFILAEGSRHHIHLDASQLVVDAIQEMVRESRQ